MKHIFKWNDNGKLEHSIDDVLRATIDPEHVADYKSNFPGVKIPAAPTPEK